jgi:5-methylcytosine-specific restriction endonuclease McrA
MDLLQGGTHPCSKCGRQLPMREFANTHQNICVACRLKSRERIVPDVVPTSSKPLRQRVYERDGYQCVTCGSRENLTLDHHIPRSRGGPTTYDNLRTMCKQCNGAKADSMPEGLARAA